MPTLERIDAGSLRAVMESFRDAVHRHAGRLDALNVYPVPDGDTGTNMARTLDAVVEEVAAAPGDLGSTCAAISHGALMGARGNSGVILSQILRGFTATLAAADRIDAAVVAAALVRASEDAYHAVLTPVEGTILTVVRESAEAADRSAGAGADLATTLEATHAAAADALRRTPEMLPVLARAGVVDAGGAGYLLMLEAALFVVTGRAISEPLDVPSGLGVAAIDTPAVVGVRPVATGPRYEVMYFCEIDDEVIDDLRSRWGEIGDSIVVVGGDRLWNCHIHTDQIGASIEVALDLGGRPSRIRITDLFEQVAAHGEGVEAYIAEAPAPVTTAVVAVSSGDGLTEMFRGLGVSVVVGGGQSDNPSTADLLGAIERCVAESVVILPNNKNIIPVARQTIDLASVPVHVVPTVSMPEGLAAMVVYDPESTGAEVHRAMATAAAAVSTGEVTRAVRPSESTSGPVAAGDWIGLVRGDGIVAGGPDAAAVVIDLLAHLIDDDSELVSIVTGDEADPDVMRAVSEWLERSRSGVEVEIRAGGQPLYPYIIGVE